MALPFINFSLTGGRLVTATEHPDSVFDTVFGVQNNRLYSTRLFLFIAGLLGKIPANRRIFLVPSDVAHTKGFFGDWFEKIAELVQKRHIAAMRAGFGVEQNSYLSVWDNGIELQFYFYPALDLLETIQGIDMSAELATIGGIMSTIKPISDRVFLEAMEEDRMTKSGIVLPDSAEKERPVKGRIIAVGAGKLNDNGGRNPMSVKVGDVVLFKKYGPDEIELEGKKYLVAEESDILAILES